MTLYILFVSWNLQDYGDLEFKPTQAIYDICSETGLDTHAVPLPGGEPYEETKKRTAKFLNVCSYAYMSKLTDALFSCEFKK